MIIKQNKLLAKFLGWTYVAWNDKNRYDYNNPLPSIKEKDIHRDRKVTVKDNITTFDTKIIHIPTGERILPNMALKLMCINEFMPGWYCTRFPFPFKAKKSHTAISYVGRTNFSLSFDRSLDELVPVVNKLAKNGIHIKIAVYAPNNIPYKYSVTFNDKVYIIDTDMTKAVYNACVDAVKLFNLNR